MTLIPRLLVIQSATKGYTQSASSSCRAPTVSWLTVTSHNLNSGLVVDLGKNKLGFCENSGKIRNKIKDNDGFTSHTKMISHSLSTNSDK